MSLRKTEDVAFTTSNGFTKSTEPASTNLSSAFSTSLCTPRSRRNTSSGQSSSQKSSPSTSSLTTYKTKEYRGAEYSKPKYDARGNGSSHCPMSAKGKSLPPLKEDRTRRTRSRISDEAVFYQRSGSISSLGPIPRQPMAAPASAVIPRNASDNVDVKLEASRNEVQIQSTMLYPECGRVQVPLMSLLPAYVLKSKRSSSSSMKLPPLFSSGRSSVTRDLVW